MGFLRKTVKKIGKAIKKVVKKVGKAFGKLGIVGQLGLMMFMPQFGLSNIWGRLGSFAKTGSSLLHKAVGHIYNAGNAVGKVYKTVTDAIGNGFDRAKNLIKGEGFTLTDPSKALFGPQGKFNRLKDGDTLFDPVKTAEQKFVEEKGLSIDLDATDKAGIKFDVEGSKKFSDAIAKSNVDKEKLSLLAKGKDIVSETYRQAVNKITDPTELADSITSGALSGISSKISMEVAGDMPVQKHVTTNLDLASLTNYSQGNVISEVDFMQGNNAYQSMGSTWGASSSIAAPYLTKYTFGNVG